MIRYFAIILFLIICNGSVHSQVIMDTSLKVELDEVVFSAHRYEKNLSHISRSVQVINQEQIISSNANSLSELLSQVAGIFSIGTNQTPGQLQAIFARGANSNQSNILIDGVKLSNASSTDNIVDLSELSLSNIERIEIIRGNHSTLFGSSSIGTTINIITLNSKSQGWHGNHLLRYGSMGKNTSLVDQSMNLSYQFKNGLYNSFSYFNNQTRGINATVDTITDPNNFKFNNSDQDDFRKRELWYKLGFINNKWNSFIQYRFNSQYSDLDKGAFRDDDNFTSVSRRNTVTINNSYNIDPNWSFNLISGFNSLNYKFVDDSSRIDNIGTTDHTFINGEYLSRTFNTDLNLRQTNKYYNINYGLHHSYDQMSFSNYYYNFTPGFGAFELFTNLDSSIYSLYNIAAYINSDISLGLIHQNLSKIHLNASIRNNWNSAFKNFINFELNPYYQLNSRTIVYSNFSTAFVAPSIYQLYAPDQYIVGEPTRGNPTLEVESSRSIELGIRSQSSEFLQYEISFYYNKSFNNIDYVYLWKSDKEIPQLVFADYIGDTYINIGNRITYGIDARIKMNPTDRIEITGNINWVRGRTQFIIKDLDREHTKDYQLQLYNSGLFLNQNQNVSTLARRPSTMGFNTKYKISDKLHSSILYSYIGRRNDVYYEYSLGPFGALASQALGVVHLFDLNLNYLLNKNTSFQLRMENVLNNKYSDILGYNTRGRSIYVQAGFMF